MTDLNDFEDGGDDAPSSDQKPTVRITHSSVGIRAPGKGKLAGYVAETSNRGTAFLAYKRRKKHLYRKQTAYALSQSIIGKLQAHDVDVVIFYEQDTTDIYVFKLQQFAGGDEVPHAPDDDPQNYVPCSAARELFKDSVNPAIDFRQGGNAGSY